jgi:hypothetical protein
MVDVVLWIILGVAILYVVIRLTLAWLVPNRHGDIDPSADGRVPLDRPPLGRDPHELDWWHCRPRLRRASSCRNFRRTNDQVSRWIVLRDGTLLQSLTLDA